MKLLNNISRIFIGIVFVFSGFVKAIDPLGSTYKFVDYFEAFGMDFLTFMALPLAIILSTLELVIGFSLLFGTKKKLTVWLLSLFMGFFTILTFILAIFNPVTDCGCFGDAIIMTNWQTFGKNIFLMIFVVILYINKEKFEVNWTSKKQWLIISIPTIFSILLSIYCYNNLPIIDFRPYKIGTYIPEKMVMPEDAPRAEYETTLIYTKDGDMIEVSLENIPDSTWEWVESKNVLISEGYIPPIHDFTIETLAGNDITEIVLNDDKFTFLFIAYDLKKTNTKNMYEISKFANLTKKSGKCNFICMTSSAESEINEFVKKTHAPFTFFNTDEITLKTIVRSNPGIVLLKKGRILGKWHHRNTPSFEEISNDFLENPKYKKSNKTDEALANLN
jgi:uncharacterized membrane protein YphA (DoxX/SURF4 family)